MLALVAPGPRVTMQMPGRPVIYKIKAVNSNGTSAYSNEASAAAMLR